MDLSLQDGISGSDEAVLSGPSIFHQGNGREPGLSHSDLDQGNPKKNEKACNTCPELDVILERIREKNNNFVSKKTQNSFQEPAVNIQNGILSFNDLKHQFTEENPTWKEELISIPTTFLMKFMKKVPYCVTEEDVREYLSGEFVQAMETKKKTLQSSKITDLIENTFKHFRSGQITSDKVIEVLNEEILSIIFVGDKNTKACKKDKEKCRDPSCPLKRGLATKFDVVRDKYKTRLWPEVLEGATQSEDIIKFAENQMEDGWKKYLQNSKEFGLLANMRGQKSEKNLVPLLQSHLNVDGTPGLLLSGYRVFSSLKNLLKSYNIKLNSSPNENTQQEHDLITVIPDKDRVRVNFTQAKATLQLPWPHEGDRTGTVISACKKAFSQIIKDLDTFMQLTEQFLTKEEFDQIDFSFTVSVTSLDNIQEQDICHRCRKYIHQENEGAEQIPSKFGIDNIYSPTESALEIYKTLSTLYIGGGSIIELKTPKDGYLKENRRVGLVNESMRKMLAAGAKKGSEMNKMIKLGPQQNNIYMSGIGLNQSYSIIAPWGGGKSMLLELELNRTIELFNESKEEVKIFLVVYEMKATSLLKHYQTIVGDLKVKRNIKIQAMNLRDISELLGINHQSRSTTMVINDICKALIEKNEEKICLYLDEVIIEHPKISCPEKLLGKVPFVLDGEVFPWSDLDSHGVNLMVCINPESQDLSQLQKLDDKTVQELKKAKPQQGPVPTIAIWRVFRSSNSIHQFIQELEKECSTKHKEFGYLIPPNAVKQGHEIKGELPSWIQVQEHKHMKCPKKECSDCFLRHIKDRFDRIIEKLKYDGIPNDDILVILSSSESRKNSNSPYEIEFLRSTHPDLNIKSNFDFDGCEAKVVIVVRNGGLLSFSLSNAISRAVSKLIIFIPDDHQILENCCKKGLLIHKHKKSKTLTESMNMLQKKEGSLADNQEKNSPQNSDEHFEQYLPKSTTCVNGDNAENKESITKKQTSEEDLISRTIKKTIECMKSLTSDSRNDKRIVEMIRRNAELKSVLKDFLIISKAASTSQDLLYEDISSTVEDKYQTNGRENEKSQSIKISRKRTNLEFADIETRIKHARVFCSKDEEIIQDKIMGKANQTTIIAPEGLALIPYSDSSTDKSESESSREFVQVPVDLDSFYLGDCEAELTETELDPENIDSDFENNLHLWKCISCKTPTEVYIRYCEKCWNIRRGNIPDRPRHRRKMRKKRRESDTETDLELAIDMDLINTQIVSRSNSVDFASEASCSGVVSVGSISRPNSSCLNTSGVASMDSCSDLDLPIAFGSKLAPDKSSTQLCWMCCLRPKNAVLVHGNSGHQACCYPYNPCRAPYNPNRAPYNPPSRAPFNPNRPTYDPTRAPPYAHPGHNPTNVPGQPTWQQPPQQQSPQQQPPKQQQPPQQQPPMQQPPYGGYTQHFQQHSQPDSDNFIPHNAFPTDSDPAAIFSQFQAPPYAPPQDPYQDLLWLDTLYAQQPGPSSASDAGPDLHVLQPAQPHHQAEQEQGHQLAQGENSYTSE